MITDQPVLKEVFPQPPVLSHRKNRNLRNILVHSSIASEPRSRDRFQITEPCKHPSCLTCHSMSNTRHIINHCNKRNCDERNGNRVVACYTLEQGKLAYKENCITGKEFCASLDCHSIPRFLLHGQYWRTPAAGGNCSTSNVVYGAECLKHKQLYVGYTNRPVHVRFNNYRSDITTHRLIIYVYIYRKF